MQFQTVPTIKGVEIFKAQVLLSSSSSLVVTGGLVLGKADSFAEPPSFLPAFQHHLNCGSLSDLVSTQQMVMFLLVSTQKLVVPIELSKVLGAIYILSLTFGKINTHSLEQTLP